MDDLEHQSSKTSKWDSPPGNQRVTVKPGKLANEMPALSKQKKELDRLVSIMNKYIGSNRYTVELTKFADGEIYAIIDTKNPYNGHYLFGSNSLSNLYSKITNKKNLKHSDDRKGGNTMKYDFGGYATKVNVKCSDGRTIAKDAFKDCDGNKVPLVWQHFRDDPTNVVGHAILENRADGVYAYCNFNSTSKAKHAKILVEHGDITALSIYANHLTHQGNNVTHGMIREVSLVIAGANPEAFIDNIAIKHSDGSVTELDDEAIVYMNVEGLEHSVELDTEDTDEDEDDKVEHADAEPTDEAKAKTVKEVFDSLTDDQKVLFYAMVGTALEQGASDEEEGKSEDEVKHSDINEGGTGMKKNVFEGKETTPSLSHDDRIALFKQIQSYAADHNVKLSKAIADHTETFLEHGITDIESLFPDYKSLNNPPEWIGQPEEWVNIVWNGTSKTPFSRIKSAFADITKDEARARGYIKGKKKEEEQFSLLRRTTDPQTVYKLQKLDRDDVIDITDFDVVAWLKSEMRMKLQEELSRAILIGDGRSTSSEQKIQENHIRPILNDDAFYTIKYSVDLSSAVDSTDRANAIIDGAAYAMIDYKGSGGATAFMSPQSLADMRVAKDKNGRRLYNSVSEIASALGVSKIVEVPLMKDLIRTTSTTIGDAESDKKKKVHAIIVNLRDYNVGADRGGQTTMFDDFDLDYNKLTYLIETRCSGALTRPTSAIVIESDADGVG